METKEQLDKWQSLFETEERESLRHFKEENDTIRFTPGGNHSDNQHSKLNSASTLSYVTSCIMTPPFKKWAK